MEVDIEKYFQFTSSLRLVYISVLWIVIVGQKMEETSRVLLAPISFLWRNVLLQNANFPMKT